MLPANNNVAPTAALLLVAKLLILAAPARGGKLVDAAAYINCTASTTCTSLCAANARAARRKLARVRRRPARLLVPCPALALEPALIRVDC